MKMTIELDIVPFEVPKAVRIIQGVAFSPEVIAIGALDAVALQRLCDEFTKAVFKKAGKKLPRSLHCSLGAYDEIKS